MCFLQEQALGRAPMPSGSAPGPWASFQVDPITMELGILPAHVPRHSCHAVSARLHPNEIIDSSLCSDVILPAKPTYHVSLPLPAFHCTVWELGRPCYLTGIWPQPTQDFPLCSASLDFIMSLVCHMVFHMETPLNRLHTLLAIKGGLIGVSSVHSLAQKSPSYGLTYSKKENKLIRQVL